MKAPSTTVNVVLTGASGFLGKAVLREFRDRVEEGVLQKVNFFLPIRGNPQNGITGQERCETLSQEHGFFYSHSSKKSCEIETAKICVNWIDPALGTDAWPSEINIAMLCAFDNEFERPLRDMLHSSVCPIIYALRSVAKDIEMKDIKYKRFPSLSEVVLVSTSYVQPPLPFLRRGPEGERVGAWAAPKDWGKDPIGKLFERLVGLEDLSMELVRKTLSGLSEQTLQNSYLFCKTLIEVMVDYDPSLTALSKENYVSLSMIRPSIIGASLDGKHYSVKSPGCSTVLMGHLQLLGRGAPWWGSIDLVPVCRVAKAVLKAASVDNADDSATDINWPLSDTVVGCSKAKIRYVTNGISYSTLVLSKSCGKWLVSAFPQKLLPLIQQFECMCIILFSCSLEAGAQIKTYYKLYECYASNTFDFPTVLGLNIPEILMPIYSSSGKPIQSKYSSWVQDVFNEQTKATGSQISIKISVIILLLLLVVGYFYKL